MQRKLTLALLLTALASIALVGVGTLLLSQANARKDAETDVLARIEAVSKLGESSGQQFRPETLAAARLGLGFDRLELVVVDSEGVVAQTVVEDGGRARGRRPQTVELTPPRPESFPAIQLDASEIEALRSGSPIVLSEGGSVVAIQAASYLSATDPLSEAALMASQDVSAINSQLITWFLLASLAVLAAALMAASFLAKRLTTPLKAIKSTTIAIAGGDLAARNNVSSKDEVGELGAAVNEMAGELERSKALDQQFLMSVSHDLRTPLTAISGYAEAIADGAVSNYQAAGQIIKNQSERLERLVRDLLDLARLDANKFQLTTRTFDLNVAVGRAVASVAPMAHDANIELRITNSLRPPVNPEVGVGPKADEAGTSALGAGSRSDVQLEPQQRMVHADADRVEQAVLNLIDNALKFAKQQIVVEIVRQGNFEVINVRDDGPGVPKQDQPHLFERLYTGSAKPKRGENSTGIGLAIVRELAHAMSGEVSVSDNPGGGACLSLSIPSAMTD